MKRFSFRAFAALAVSILALGGFAGGLPVAHAQTAPAEVTDAGLQQVGSVVNLSAADPRSIVVRIINVALSVIAIILVSIIVYAGFLWMTSGGDASKTEKAKKYIQNAIIGLLIIVSAWAITKFVISALLDATGNNGTGGTTQNGSNPGGSFGSPGSSGGFILEGVTPAGSVPLRNVQVRFLFSRPVSTEEVNAKLHVSKVEGNEAVAGRFEIDGGLVTFTPTEACPAPNADRFCFDADTDFVARVDASFRSASGQAISCGGLGAVCEGRFRTGDQVDVAPPTARLLQPYDGQSIPQNQAVELIGAAEDDSGVSILQFSADGQTVGRATPAGGVTPTSFEGRVVWNTEGVSLGAHQLQMSAFDIDSNRAESDPVSVMVRAESCSDGAQNGDETAIDCGGSCGVCGGGSCQETSQCARGVCSEGRCVERPVITAITPNNGKIGTIITISGANFGASGDVTFAGGARGVVPAACTSLGSGWSDRAIIVEVPVGAQTGPVTVRNASSGISDRSDDEVGPNVGAYTVNTAAYPGLCALDPDHGPIGTAITATGAGFGSASDRVRIGDAIVSAFRGWTDSEIQLNIPAVQNGTMSTRVAVGETWSNPVPLRVEVTQVSAPPVIESIEPASGPIGEYLTIRGRNFGYRAGTVRMAGLSGAEGDADADFPPACDQATRYWTDTSVTIKVPPSLRGTGLGGSVPVTPGSYQFFLQRQDGSSPSNRVDVEVTSGAPHPGLCAVTPDVGPTGTEIRLNGERFGDAQGQVTFDGAGRSVDAVSILEWTDQQVRALVPAGAQTGSVKVSAASQASNPLPYAVQNCATDASVCSATQRCCEGSGVCVARAGGVCPALNTDAHYAWRLSTGELPIFPEVVNECNPASRRLASPSPSASRPGGDQACVNSDIIIRFTTKLKASEVSGSTVVVRQCAGADGDCSAGTVVPAAVGFPRVEAADSETDLIRFRPASNGERWSPASFYRVTLTTGIQSARGVAMPEKAECGDDNAYCFRFGTRPSSELCAVGAVLVNPAEYQFEDIDEDVDVHANPLAAGDACLQLNPDSYAWAWKVVDQAGRADARVTLSENAGPMGLSADQTATSHAEVDRLDPSLATASVMVGRTAVSGAANLSVALRPFTIESHGPDCGTACVNAAVWAKLSSAVQPTSVTPANIEIRRCADTQCRTTDDPIALAANLIRVTALPEVDGDRGLGRFILVNASAGLRPGQTYRVLVKSGPAGGIVSLRGQPLASLNDPQGYAWTFTTKTENNGLCSTDRVVLAPNEKVERVVGARQRFTAVPMSAPTLCSETGEYLVSTQPYAWSVVDRTGAPDATIARLVQRTDDASAEGAPVDNDAPVRAGMSTEDQQIAEIIATRDPGEGQTRLMTNIRAAYDGRTGQAGYGLLCGQRLESACPAGSGLTDGGCCAPRPTIASRYPAIGGTGICRNTLIFADFSTTIDSGSLQNNLLLAKRVAAVTCPAETRPLDVALAGGEYRWYDRVWRRIVALFRSKTAEADVWCVGAIPGQVEVTPQGTGSRVTYRIANALDAGTEYRMYVRGEADFVRNATSSVIRSERGVRMAQEAANWTFTTGARVCEANQLQVNDTSSESPYLYSKHPETHVWEATVQSVSPGGVLVPITSVAQYAWNWGPWISSQRDVLTTAATGASTPHRANVGENNKNGQSAISARFEITRDEVNTPSTTGRVVETARIATVNLCERPWPSLALGVFADAPDSASLRALAPSFASGPFFNFSTGYCMDAGTSSTADDLSALQLNAVPLTANDTDQGIARQYLFSFREPALRGDGIGIRIASNPLHLTAADWYASRGFNGTPSAATVDGYDAVRDGNTVYISGSNFDTTGGTVGSSIYILSRNPNATAETQKIFDQLVANFKLNVNLTQDTGNVCVAPQAAGGARVYLRGDQPVSCSADWECGTIDQALRCASAKAKLQRDRVRIADFQTFNGSLESFKSSNGKYPQIKDGSFIPGISTSRWPSWDQSFATELGGTSVPRDPVNRFATCGRCQAADGTLGNICSATSECASGNTCVPMTGTDAARNGFDPATCWNPAAQRFLCPAVQADGRTLQTSHVYQYRTIDQGSRYELSTNFEGAAASLYRPTLITNLRRCSNGGRVCTADTDCRVVGPTGSVVSTGTCNATGGTWIYGGACSNVTYAAASTCSVTGPLGEGQECRTGDTRRASCEVNGQPGTKIQVCSDCRSFADGPQTVCTPNVVCGNGVIDAGETCDDGADNGRYGHCSRTCQAPQGSCGDGVVGGGEVCDNGSPVGTAVAGTSGVNGAYCGLGCNLAQSCSLDCRAQASHCGDAVVDGPEQCDGNSQQTAGKLCVSETAEGVRVLGEPCTQDSECGGGVCGRNDSRAAECPVQRVSQCSGGTRPGATCAADGECGAGGRCVILSYPSFHIRSCKTAGAAGQCTFNAWSACQMTSSCGDGVVDTAGGEECDDGVAGNSGTGRCTPRCKLNRCGDGFVQDRVEDCDQGQRNGIVPPTIQYGTPAPVCTTSCRYAAVSGGYCGNNVIESNEVCDGTAIPIDATCRALNFDYAASTVGGHDVLSCNSRCDVTGCMRCSTRLAPDQNIVTARVVDGILQNRGLPQARVVLLYNNITVGETYTDNDGVFRFGGIHDNAACGNYTVSISLQGRKYNYVSKELNRTTDPNDGYYPYLSDTFSYRNFRSVVGRYVAPTSTILLMPRPGDKETLVIREFNGVGSRSERIGQVTDPHLLLPRTAGYTGTGASATPCVGGSSGCKRTINWSDTKGSLDMSRAPYAGLACYEADTDNTCSSWQAVAETIYYKRSTTTSGAAYRYFLVNFVPRQDQAGADGTIDSTTVANKVRILWRDNANAERYLEVKPDTSTIGASNDACKKYWHVFDQDAVTGNITIVNRFMCNPTASGTLDETNSLVDQGQPGRVGINALLSATGSD